MAKRRLGVHIYRQIIIRLRAGEGTRKIAAAGLACRKVVKQVKKLAEEAGWLLPFAEAPTEDQVTEVFGGALTLKIPRQVSLVEPHRAKVEKWIEDGVQAQTIFTALKRQHLFTGSYGSVLRFVQRIRGQEPEAYVPLHFEPSDAAQVDFGSGPVLTDPATGKERRTHIFVMTLAFSRHMYAEIVWDQKVATWLRCHKNAFAFFGGCVRRVIIDNLKSAITRACHRDPEVQRSYEEYAEGYGFLICPCRPRTPRHKGRVEAGVKYVKNSFVPTRKFRSIGDANQQLLEWVLGEAGNRVHGTTRQVPLCVFAESEKPLLRPLPADPPELVTWAKLTLHSTCHVTFEGSYYSAPYRLLRKELLLRAGERLVSVHWNDLQVALHKRATRPGQWMTDEGHLPPHKVAHMQRTPQWCLRRAEEIGPQCLAFVERLFGNRIVDRLPGVHGVLSFVQKYGAHRVEAACRRALAYENITYSAVKKILGNGLDQAPLEEETGGQLNFRFVESSRFSRDIGKLLKA
jgi:transposase